MADTPVPAQYEGGTHRTAYGLGSAALFVASAAFFVTQPFILHPTLVAGPQFNPAQIQPVLFHQPPASVALAAPPNRPLFALAAQDPTQLKAQVWGSSPATLIAPPNRPRFALAAQDPTQLKANVWGPRPPTASPQILQPIFWVAGQPQPQPPSSIFAPLAPPAAAPLLPGCLPQWIPNQDPFQPQPLISRVLIQQFQAPPLRPLIVASQAGAEQRAPVLFKTTPSTPAAQVPSALIVAGQQQSVEINRSFLTPAFFDTVLMPAGDYSQFIDQWPFQPQPVLFQQIGGTQQTTPMPAGDIVQIPAQWPFQPQPVLFQQQPPSATPMPAGDVVEIPEQWPFQPQPSISRAFFDQLRAPPPGGQFVSLPASDRQVVAQASQSGQVFGTPALLPSVAAPSSGIGGGGGRPKRHQIRVGDRILEGSKEQIEAIAREIAIRERDSAPEVVEIVVPNKGRKPALTAKTQLAADVRAAYSKAVADEVARQLELDDEEALIALLT